MSNPMDPVHYITRDPQTGEPNGSGTTQRIAFEQLRAAGVDLIEVAPALPAPSSLVLPAPQPEPEA